MKTENVFIIRKNNILMVAAFSFLFMVWQNVVAEDFAKVSYDDRQVIWDISLPEGATGVMVRVLYTPNDLKADSFLEEVFVRGGTVVYPFNGELEDGTYTWEFRLLHDGAKLIGYEPNSKVDEGPIDENGRQTKLVGEPLPVPKGKIRVSNSGRGSVQNGGFRVVKGTIPDFKMEEPVDRQTKM